MNYAWANPSVGFREQTNQGTPERMLAEAKRTVWLELQELCAMPPAAGAQIRQEPECQIWRQEPIGTVTVNGPHIDTAKALSIDPDGEAAFAWCDPVDGKRIISARFPGQEVVDQMKHLKNVMNDSKTDVIVYATWSECVVHRSDPEPPPFQDEEFRRFDETCAALDALREKCGEDPARPPSEVDRRKADLQQVVVLDDETRIGLQSAWALLEIADRLAVLVATQQTPKRPPRRLGLWERFVLWVWGSPKEESVTPPKAGAEDSPTLEDLASTSTHRFAPYLAGDLICRCGAAWYEAIHGQNGETLNPRSGGTPTDKETWPEDEQKRYGEDSQSEKRKQAVESRGPAPIDPGKPHVFRWQPHLAGSPSVSDYCEHCGKPQDDPIHGYTGV